MTSSLLLERPESLPTRIGLVHLAIAFLEVPVDAALRTKTLTLRVANHVWIYREHYLFANRFT